MQIQHTPKLKPGLAHKSFCKFLCPTSRCASTPSYTLHPSQASPQTHPPPSSLAWHIVPDTSVWCETASPCQHPNLSSREAAKRYHLFPSPSQGLIQSGLPQKRERTSTQPAQLLTSKLDPTRHPTLTARSHQGKQKKKRKNPPSSLILTNLSRVCHHHCYKSTPQNTNKKGSQ